MASGWAGLLAGGWQGKVSLVCISWYDLDLTFHLVVVTLTFKILSGLYLGNGNVQEVDTLVGTLVRQCS